MEQMICQVYPVLYAEELKFTEQNYLDSACYNQLLYDTRKRILNAALRPQDYSKRTKKNQDQMTLEDMTRFRPFDLRELIGEVWDVKETNYENYVIKYRDR